MLSKFPTSQQIRDAFFPLAMIFLASRLTLLIITSVTLLLASAQISSATLLCHWDCEWYLGIAKNGYSAIEVDIALGHFPGQTNFAFYPLFPLLVRNIMPLLGGDALYAGIVVANICFFVAIFYVYLYARELGLDRNAGLLAACILCVFPQSIVFSAPFSESMSLLLMAATVYHLRREHYLAAGIAAAMLSAARPNGVLIIIFMLAWLIQKDGFRALISPWRAPEKFVPILLAPLGMFLFFGYCYMATGDAFAHRSTEWIGWGWSFVSPQENMIQLLASGGYYAFFALIGLGAMLCALVLLYYRIYAEFIYCIASILLIFSGTGVISLFRYWMILFPIWVGFARMGSTRPLSMVLSCSVLGMINGAMACAWVFGSAVAI